MNCLRCGRNIPADQVFCDGCLDSMKEYPVKPETPVVLPNRATAPQPKRVAHRKTRMPEEIIADQRLWLKILTSTVLVLMVTLAAATFLLLRLWETKAPEIIPGQNYSTGPVEMD